MKKRSFKLSITFFAIMLCAFIFSACGEINFKFNDQQLVLGINQEVSLESLVTIQGGNISNIEFKSSNTDVVIITPRLTLVTGNVEGTALITANGFEGGLEIVVVGESRTFDAPQNVVYNQDASRLEWSAVYAGNVVANSYRLSITKNDEELPAVYTNKNYYTITDSGSFKVTIACMQNLGVKQSAESQELKFEKLPAPTNVQFDDSTGKITWQADDSVTAFYIKKNGVLTDKIYTKEYVQQLTDVNTYKISIVSALTNQTQNVYGSESEVLTLTRLTAPNLVVQDGIITWSDAQDGVSEYLLQVYQVLSGSEAQTPVITKNISYNGSNYSYQLQGVTTGNYVVKVQALGDGANNVFNSTNHFLNSAVSKTTSILKLAKPALNFNKSENTISVLNFDAVAGLSLSLKVYLNDQLLSEEDISSTGKYVCDFANTLSQVGTYSFSLTNKAKNSAQIDSDESEIIQVVKLAQISTIEQRVLNNNYYIDGLTLNNADSFVVQYKNLATGRLADMSKVAGEQHYGAVGNYFKDGDSYQVIVTAKGTDYIPTPEAIALGASATARYVIDSTTVVQVIRLGKFESFGQNVGQNKFEWAPKLNNIEGIVYKYTIVNNAGTTSTIEGTTQDTSYNYSSLVAGNYTITVTQEGATSSTNTLLIIGASEGTSASMIIEKQLDTPTLAVSREQDGYKLQINPVLNANTYQIKCNSASFITLTGTTEQELSTSLNTILANVGSGDNGQTYVFEVVATNSQNEYYKAGAKATLMIEKLAVPTAFTLSEQEKITLTKTRQGIQDYEVYLANSDVLPLSYTKADTLSSDVNNYTIKVKYVSDMINYGGKYYIDSNEATFALNRMPTTLSAKGLLVSWNANSTTQLFTSTLNFKQGEHSHNMTVSGMYELNVGLADLVSQGFNLSNPIAITLSNKFGAFGGTIDGSYVNGVFQSDANNYYISSQSNTLLLSYATNGLQVTVTENATGVQVAWAGLAGASYTLFDSVREYPLIQNDQSSATFANSVTLDAGRCNLPRQYIMSLVETTASAQNVYIFMINRLNPVANLTVNSNETISADAQTGAEKCIILNGSTEIASLQEVASTLAVTTITAKYVAMSNVNSYTFYLDSAGKDYPFIRLQELNTTGNLNIYNNIISWTKEGEVELDKYKYVVNFLQNDVTVYSVELNAETTNSIDLAQETYQQIINSMTGSRAIQVIKVAGTYTASTEATNYLSSAPCAKVPLKLISAPTNISITTTDLQNQVIAINWQQNQEGVDIAKYTLSIEHNGVTTTIENVASGYTIEAENELFKQEGAWIIKVKAIGNNDSIDSVFSEPFTVTRLSASSSLKINKQGKIYWNPVQNVSAYKVVYSYYNKDNLPITGEETVTADSLFSNVFAEKLNDAFDGNLKINLYSLGNNSTTLTSTNEEYFTRLQAPEISIQKDSVLISNYQDYPAGTTIFVQGTINQKVVVNYDAQIQQDQDGNYIWKIPTTFSYINEQGQTTEIDLTTQNSLQLVFTAKNTSDMYLNSNSTSVQVTTLSPMYNLRFVRDEQGFIHFMAQNSNANATGVVLSVGEYSITLNGNVDLKLTEDVLINFASSWTITLQTQGEYKNNTYFVNGKEVAISGTKLARVNNISTSNGAIVWDAVAGAQDYRLYVDESVYLTNYKSERKETLKANSFTSGAHIVNIKALGNISTTEVYSDIVLDSDYSTSRTITKIAEIADLDIKNGYFSFTAIDGVSEYMAEVYASAPSTSSPVAEYALVEETKLPFEDGQPLYYNQQLLNKIKELQEAYIKVYNKTQNEMHVYSNYAYVDYNGESKDYIKVQILQNENETVELYHPTRPNGELSYDITHATWEQNTNASTGYLFNLDGTWQYLTENELVLDANQELTAGIHRLSYKQLGSNGLTEGRLAYLTGDFSLQITVTKLSPVPMAFTFSSNASRELCVTFGYINGADRYYAYTKQASESPNDIFYKEFQKANTSPQIMMSELTGGQIYDAFGMRAVNTQNVNYLASSTSYLATVDGDDILRVVSISKKATPSAPTMKDGAFYWEIPTSSWITMLSSAGQGSYNVITSPLEMSLLDLSDSKPQKLEIKFTSKESSARTYTFLDDLRNYIYMSETQRDTIVSTIEQALTISGAEAEAIEQYKQTILAMYNKLGGGFPSTNHGFNKFATTLPAGAYDVQVRLIGSNGLYQYVDNTTGEVIRIMAKFSSSYLNLGTKYVAPAPSVTAVAQNGLYTLEFDNVSVDTSYISQQSYNLIGVYYDEELEAEKEMVVATTQATSNTAHTISFNLTDLIESEDLTKSFNRLYVTIKGDNSRVFNGKPSNAINIKILEQVVTRVEHGVVTWQAQIEASGYNIVYNKIDDTRKDTTSFEQIDGTEWYTWTASELNEEVTYNLTIQAIGHDNVRIKNSTEFKMSGKITKLGKAQKLKSISKTLNGVDIVNGIFVWNAIANATTYDVFVDVTSAPASNIGTNYYETEVTDYTAHEYYFMAIGTESADLSATSFSYLNSNISECNNATRLGDINSISFVDGIIEFTPGTYGLTGRYKLSFYKIDPNGNREERIEVFLNGLTKYDTNDNPQLLSYGQYALEIQACYQNKTADTSADDTYYVISSKKGKASTSFYKFEQVSNIQVKEGKVSWEYANIDNKPTSDFNYLLIFNNTTKSQTVEKVIPATQKYFEDVVFTGIETSDIIKLTVYVVPAQNTNSNYVHSVSLAYEDNIHQYQKVDETKIKISTTDDSQLKVDWSEGISSGVTEGFKYEISFSANNQEKKFHTTVPYFITGEGNDISFNLQGAYTLIIKIRVIPTINNFISSEWTADKEITRPKGISNLKYENYVFTWDKYQVVGDTNSFEYKIKDVVTYKNASNQDVTEVYILTAGIGDEKFEPFVIGEHTVSIAVMVAGAQEDGAFISEYTSCTGTMNLFEGGNGTSGNPYLIANATQFSNMQYRMSKDAKNNSYYHGTVAYVQNSEQEEATEVITLETEKTVLSDEQAKYYFKQTAHITVSKNGDLDQTLVTVEKAYQNSYNGDYYQLTLSFTHKQRKSDVTKISLFNTLGKSAKIENINLKFAIRNNQFTDISAETANISVLCQTNNGSIQNIIVGEKDTTISINLASLQLNLSFIANNNFGTISSVKNYYSVTIDDVSVAESKMLQFASIAINNGKDETVGVIDSAINEGTINVKGTMIYVGGLVALNNNGSTITGGANRGDIVIHYNSASKSYVGGIVASNNNGVLAYCYSVSNFTITKEQTNAFNANIGGLVGYSNGDKISYSYVSISKTTSADIEIYQVVGNLESELGNSQHIYYKNIAGFSACNKTLSGASTYSTNPIEANSLFNNDTRFNKTDVDDNNNPHLKFERELDSYDWKE